MELLSVVIPSYNEAESLPTLLEEIQESLRDYPYEVIVVDDGSSDNSFAVLRRLMNVHPQLQVYRFRRNLGKSAALSVGFQRARGDVVVTMDADLQDVPAEIPKLVEKLNTGYDLVSGWKEDRQDSREKTLPSRLFNAVTSRSSGIDLHDFNCGLKAYRGEVVKAIELYGERHRFIPILAKNAGFPAITEQSVHHRPRQFGASKYGLERYGKGFMDLMTIMFLSRYSNRPGHLFGLTGVVLLGLGILISLYLSIEWLLGNTALSNRPLLWFGMMLIGVGIQFMMTGLLAELILATSGQSRQMPEVESLSPESLPVSSPPEVPESAGKMPIMAERPY